MSAFQKVKLIGQQLPMACAAMLMSPLLLAMPVVVNAQFNFTTNNGAITITGYTGPGGAVTIPSMTNGLPVKSIGNSAFASLGNVTSVTIPNSVTNIGGQAFYYCTGLTSAPIPDSVSAIGTLAFFRCTSLTNITILSSVISIGDSVFANCTSLTSATIADGVTNIGNFTFGGCARLPRVTIPNSVTSIGNSVFQLCTSLTNITMPDSITSLGTSAFSSCSGLTSVAIPSSVTSIGSRAFASCNNLSNVTIPNSVTSIGTYAFQTCTHLTSIIIPASVTNIGLSAFDSCTSLTAITVNAPNPFYSSAAGVLCDQNQTTLIECPAGKAGSFTVPNTVTNIAHFSFLYCTYLTGIYFRSNAPNLGTDAFNGDNNTLIYYLPGTTGFGTTYGGRPTALWKPQMQTGDGFFGVRTNQFGFNISWASGMGIVVEASTNLANPIWSPLQTNTLSGDSLYFNDPQWTNYSDRFYRIRWQ